MNLFNPNARTGKVHSPNMEGRPLCGGGRNGKSAQYQQDFGAPNCKACEKLKSKTIKAN